MIEPLAPASGGGGCGMEGWQIIQSFPEKFFNVLVEKRLASDV